MGEVIPFKNKRQRLTDRNPEANIDLSNVADENLHWLIDNTELISYDALDGALAELGDLDSADITSCHDYQMFLKKYLTKEDYEAVVLAIMDPEYFAELEDDLRNLVETYYSYETV